MLGFRPHHRHDFGGGAFRRGPAEFGGGFERGGGRGRRMFDAGELRLVLLKLLADQPRHGYDLIRAIEELTGSAYAPSPGVIYPTITLLQDMELIEERRSEGTRRLFAVTAAGTAHLAERADEVTALFARLAALGDTARKADSGPVRRAIHNLRQVLHHRLGGEEVGGDTLHEVAALIDEAARKIERL